MEGVEGHVEECGVKRQGIELSISGLVPILGFCVAGGDGRNKAKDLRGESV